MAFAISLVAKGFQAARSGLIAIRDGVLGVASAERRLAADTAHAAREQDKLAASARKAHQELKAAAAAFRAANEARGINPLTGGAATTARDTLLRGESGTLASRRLLLGSVARQGLADQAALIEARRNADGGGNEHLFGRLGGRIGRIFGEKGAKVGEALGGTLGGLAPVFGAIGLTAVAASMALGEFGKAVDRAKEDVRHIGEIRNEIRDAILDAVKSANQAAIGEAKANRGAIASLVGSGKLDEAQKLARGLGSDGLRAEGILNQKRLMGNKNVQEALRLAVATGQISAEQFANTIGSARGLSGIGSAEGIAKAVLAQNGAIGVNVGQAGARFGASKFGQAFNALDEAEEHRSNVALGRFAAGGTEVGIREDAGRIGSPETAAQLEINRKLEDQQKILEDVANNMGIVAKIFDGIVNRGDSARNTALRGARVTGEAVNPDAP